MSPLHVHIDLLAALLKGRPGAAADLVRQPGFDCELLGRFLAHHQLSGYVHTHLADDDLREHVPPALLAQCRTAFDKQAKTNERRLAELKRLNAQFAAAQQSFILLKGIYLGERFYRARALRTSWDIDLLVRREAMPPVQALLAEQGYRRISPVLLHEGLSRRFTHAFDYARGGVELDLHWALSDRPSFRIDYEALWERKQTYLLDGTRFFVLPDTYSLALNLTAAVSDLERGALRLRSLVDLFMLLRGLPDMDWAAFFEQCRHERTAGVCQTMLALFLTVFDCRDEFPALARALDRERLHLDGRDALVARLAPSRLALDNKLWASRLYAVPRARYALWWAASLPFRLTVYKPGKWNRFKRGVRRWTKSLKATPVSEPSS